MEKEYLNSGYIRVKKRLRKVAMAQWSSPADAAESCWDIQPLIEFSILLKKTKN